MQAATARTPGAADARPGDCGRRARLLGRLFAPVDAASLGAFRIAFGLLLAWDAWRLVSRGLVLRDWVLPAFTFPYEILPFVRPWPEPFMTAHVALMGVAALAMAIGLFYRAAAAVFCATFTWAFLIDKAQYNNHSYLIALLGLLMIAVGAERWSSLDARRLRLPEVVPFWNVFLLRAQVAIVYLYGGIAKLNRDWLAGEPMRTWLLERSRAPIVGPLLASEPAVWLFSLGGLAFDLAIAPLLLWRRTRPVAIALVMLFHLTNAALFSIGIFPYLMIGATVVFCEPDLPRRALARLGVASGAPAAPSQRPRRDGTSPPSGAGVSPTPARSRRLVLVAIFAWLSVQVVVPLRHLAYPGDVSWTEEGHRFSWHMKLRAKRARVAFIVTDRRTGATWQVRPGDELTPTQRRKMEQHPDMILQYAHHVRDRLIAAGIPDPIVRADAWASLNRRPWQRLVAPDADLAEEPLRILAPSPWIVPLDEGGRPGAVPLDEGQGSGSPRSHRDLGRAAGRG